MRKRKATVAVHRSELPTFNITDDEDGVTIRDPRTLLGAGVEGTWIKVDTPEGRTKFMHLSRGTLIDKHRMCELALKARRLRSTHTPCSPRP